MPGLTQVFQNGKLTTHFKVFMGSSFQAIPSELLIEIMKHLPDMAALSRFFTAYPTALPLFKNRFSIEMLAGIMNKMSTELRESAFDVLAVRSRPPIHPSKITRFIENELNAKVTSTETHLSRHSLPILIDLITVAESIESLTESFAQERVLAPCMPHVTSLSPVEGHRIRRSFWRFQLYYDMCHPETESSAREQHVVKSRSTRRYVYHQTHQRLTDRLPNWLHARTETHRPEALSRILPNLTCWEQDEIEAIRSHLAQHVNRLQYHRSSSNPAAEEKEEEASSPRILPHQPALLQRLLRDLDAWDPSENAPDHLLVASFRQSQHAGAQYPVVWDRRRDFYAASTANTGRRFAMMEMQRGVGQWGWCLWDEGRLEGRGLVDGVFEGWRGEWEGAGGGNGDREGLWKRVCEGWEGIARAHGECVGGVYGVLERRIERRFGVEWGMREGKGIRDEEMRGEERERGWVATELDCMFASS